MIDLGFEPPDIDSCFGDSEEEKVDDDDFEADFDIQGPFSRM